jgi:hypothetical protein
VKKFHCKKLIANSLPDSKSVFDTFFIKIYFCFISKENLQFIASCESCLRQIRF